MKFAFNITSDYSIMQSLIKLDDFFDFCKINDISGAALCDDNLSGAIEFYNLSKKNNIKPCIGLSLNVENKFFSLYAVNYEGYLNLIKINSLKEMGELNFLNLKKFCSNIILVVDLCYMFDVQNFSFSSVFIGYKNSYEKISALESGFNIIFNRDVKCLYESDFEYLFFLNELGGSNNLSHAAHIDITSSEIFLEYENFFNLIDFSFPKPSLHIPVFCSNSSNYLKKLAEAGIRKRLSGVVPDVYKKRLDYELSIINSMGFVDYFLIVHDYVKYAKMKKIFVGPGRGSAAGSLVCFATGITDIDPIVFGLYFERFLNPSRSTLPDIDIDFDSLKRDLIIDYVSSKYGSACVALGCTYNTLKSKLVIREFGKLQKIDPGLLDLFLKEIDRDKSLSVNFENEKVLKFLKTYNELDSLFKVCLKFENLKRNMSTHAAGVVISDMPLDDIMPVYIQNGKYKTGYPMEYMESLGILKMDFLGLKNLTTISNIISEADVNLSSIPLDDPLVFSLFSSSNTDGIFQFETFAMKNLLSKLKPRNFSELSAAVALVRPGPSEFLNDYIAGRDGNVSFLPHLEDILSETYGVILYQEQILSILSVVGGFSVSEADVIRRAISKKNFSNIGLSKEKFIQNAVLKGYLLSDANNLFYRIEKFSGYGFNKSHSASYALIGYQMAYLKVHFESYFSKELLSGARDKKIIESYLMQMKQKKIPVLKPDINYSLSDYTIINNKLVLPLSLISGINSSIEDDIISKREYCDFFDFCLKNSNLSRDIILNLIYAGALRSFKLNIKTLVNNLDNAINFAEIKGFGKKPDIIFFDEYLDSEISEFEFLMYGFFISNHPSSKFICSDNLIKLCNVEKFFLKYITIIVRIERINCIKTKKGDDMAFLSVSDDTGVNDITVFNDTFLLISDFKKGQLYELVVRVGKNNDKLNLVLNKVKDVFV